MYLQHMLLKMETDTKYHVHCLLNITNCQSVLYTCHYIANRLYLHDSYISEFELMNYLFANLAVAGL